jgi:predicted nuclease of predicted toxin-antitoxin system
MKALVDNQLPLQLAVHLRGWNLDCIHVLEVGLERATDSEIWQIALTEDRVVVSKDEDFLILTSRPGDCGRLIWVRLGNCRNAALLAAFDAACVAIKTRQRIIEIR